MVFVRLLSTQNHFVCSGLMGQKVDSAAHKLDIFSLSVSVKEIYYSIAECRDGP